MSKNKQTTSPGYTFFIILSVLGVLATIWCVYTLFPYNSVPSTEITLAVAGFNAALLGAVGIALGRHTVEYDWNQRVLAGVCIDSLILIMFSLFVVALFPLLSLTPILLTILCVSSCDIFIRHAFLRKIEG